MKNNIQIKTAQDFIELSRYKKAWNKLLDECPGAGPTQTYGWLKAYFQHKLNKDVSWICLFAYDGHKLVAVYPFICLKKKRLPGLCIQFFAIPYDIFHTIRTDGLVLTGYEKVLIEFLKHIRVSFKVYPIIYFKSVPQCSATIRSIVYCEKFISGVKTEVGHEDIVKVKNDFPTYLSGLNSKFRREINRQRRKLEDTYEINYRIREINADDSDSFESFIDIENSGWKGEKGTSIKKMPGDYNLFKDGLNRFNDSGWLEWSFLEADGLKIASQLIIKINDVLYLWKIGYKENYSMYAPGNLLLFKFLEKSFNDKTVSEINFMNERTWLKAWDVEKRNLFDVFIFPKVFLLSWLFEVYYRLKYRAK